MIPGKESSLTANFGHCDFGLGLEKKERKVFAIGNSTLYWYHLLKEKNHCSLALKFDFNKQA